MNTPTYTGDNPYNHDDFCSHRTAGKTDKVKPLSRAGPIDRPVSRWGVGGDERPYSKSGNFNEKGEIDSRPISRRGIKYVAMQESPVAAPEQPIIRNMRPPSSSAFSGGTATRLTSAMMQNYPMTGSRTSLSLIGSQVNVRDRLVSQQGLSSVRTATARGPHTRQVQDKRYFESLLQLKCRDLTNEVTRLKRQIEIDAREHATYLVYDKRVKEMAAELTELQGKLSDYNLVVDKLNTGTERGEIVAEARDLAVANQAEAQAVEALFAERSRRQSQVAQLEKEIQQGRQVAENLVTQMKPNIREHYNTLQKESTELQQQMDQLQRELDSLNATKSSLEDQICISPVKQEAVRLYEKLAELEQRKATLIEEAKNRETPAQERETLLTRVREDNAEIASMERAMSELREQIRLADTTLEQADQDLNESHSERHAKYLELRKREETMETFLATWEESRASETQRLTALEESIVTALAAISRRLAALPTQADYQAVVADELYHGTPPKSADSQASSGRTVDSLTQQHAHMTVYLNKMEVMDTKVRTELENLRNSLAKMKEEMKIYSDLDKLRATHEEKRTSLTKSLNELKTVQPDVSSTLINSKNKHEKLEKELMENETHIQLSNLERKLIQLEQNNFGVKEYIAVCATESDYETVRKETLSLVTELNKNICANLAQTAV
ncbi:intraflagellar transport protein 74 homolog isoform X2 [Nilaparvata lugens]|uniref:intraflagellar transport protein 74 homolog isoform X2 n=1 Tax=Nilaparvata lugens TaxID=108931 RepID=UPI00193EB84D|nr:intraflagellar transport protein 74 homolog isoform X2 [Nilaparvata lugens]